MSNRIHPSEWPSPRGPWHPVAGVERLYDHGWSWCANAASHPDEHGGYPDSERHLPWDECHGQYAFLDSAVRDLDGEQVGVSVYVAASFRFGRPRDNTSPPSPRVVVEAWPIEDNEPGQRISLSPGEALRLARILVRLADTLTFFERAG
jgi:hypothetical protein